MSTAWRSEKVRRPREAFLPHAAAIEAALAGERFIFGGSFRRGAQTVGDLDVLVVRESGTFEQTLFEAGLPAPEGFVAQRSGPQIVQGDLTVGDVSVHVDFWCCTPAQFGAYSMFITGPKELNVWQRTVAIRQGLNLSQVGLLRKGVQVDDGTEQDIYRILGLGWVAPEDREAWAAPKGATRVVPVVGSSGTYEVTLDGSGAARCTCPGYKYRQRCRHLDMARKAASV